MNTDLSFGAHPLSMTRPKDSRDRHPSGVFSVAQNQKEVIPKPNSPFRQPNDLTNNLRRDIMATYSPEPNWLPKSPIVKSEATCPLTSTTLVQDSDPDAPYFRQLEQSGIRLNDRQIQAVRHITGPLQIIAPPGSGKTACIAAIFSFTSGIHCIFVQLKDLAYGLI